MFTWLFGKRRNIARELEQITASRRTIVGAFEIERRRIERDLHDGAQQYIVATGMALGEADLILQLAGELPPELADLPELIHRAQRANDDGMAAIRATVNNIHPKVLSDLGLEQAVRDVAERAEIPVAVRVPHSLPAMPEGVIATGYFLVSEALTNVAKYAPGASANVVLGADADLHISIADTGPGGAVLVPGRGLDGMRERLAAFGGTLDVSSPVGGPTVVRATIPLLLHRGESGISPLDS
ncbi:sensor histidine kinase [Arcanobacterium canis]|uniref:histidine kinase n=1 Tax=Arcanobacterium canis TaxID=999183 RepID=A0ABY8G0B6_9ACTO|nr:histidine kinase [Arcanobacterium canis]WFM84012.1 histidine kinase [Arcanobacterium canis]